MTRARAWLALSWLLLAFGGVLLGASAVVVQAGRGDLAGRSLPWGLLVALVAVGAAVRGACWWARRRLAGVLVGAAWALTTLVLAQTGPGGDVLLPDSGHSQVYLLGGLAVVAACVLVPLPTDAEPVAPPGGAEPVAASAEPEDGR